MVATESPGAPYLAVSENWLERSAPLDLSSYDAASLRFLHWQYFEPGYDHGQVEVSADGGNSWDVIAGPYDRQDVGWGAAYGNLTPYCGQSDVRLRWYFWSDETLHEQGWRFDDVLITAADSATAVQPEDPLPDDYQVISVYPNPFNESFSVLLVLPQTQFVGLSLWDLGGRKVAQLHADQLPAGLTRINGRMPQGQATGLYLLRIERGGAAEIRKMLYLK
jgi:hypothetical protein